MTRYGVAVAMAMGLLVAGCGDEYAKPDGFPDTHVRDDHYGAVYKRPAVTTEDRTLSYWAPDIAADYAAPDVTDAPAHFQAVRLPPNCALPKPSSGAEVVFVEIYSGYDDAPAYFITDDAIKAVRKQIDTSGERPDLDRLLKTSNAKPVDVFVTEAARPVYLVLATYDETIWSLQLAAGVRLDGVAVIGYEPQALAHAPEDARVGFVVHDASPQRRCMVTPQRPVTKSWTAVEKAKADKTGRGFKKTVDEARRDHAKFRSWLRARIGTPDRRIVAYRTAHVLIGPRPATPLAYRSLADAQLAHTANTLLLWGDRSSVAKTIYGLAETGG
jgi:hypothetical protein